MKRRGRRLPIQNGIFRHKLKHYNFIQKEKEKVCTQRETQGKRIKAGTV